MMGPPSLGVDLLNLQHLLVEMLRGFSHKRWRFMNIARTANLGYPALIFKVGNYIAGNGHAKHPPPAGT